MDTDSNRQDRRGPSIATQYVRTYTEAQKRGSVLYGTQNTGRWWVGVPSIGLTPTPRVRGTTSPYIDFNFGEKNFSEGK